MENLTHFKIQSRQQQVQQQQQQRTILLSRNDNEIRNINNSSVTNNDLIDYADHLYDGTKIKASDVPNLQINSLHLRTFYIQLQADHIIGEKEIPANKSVDLCSVQGTTIELVSPVVIAGLWIYYMQKKCLKKNKGKDSKIGSISVIYVRVFPYHNSKNYAAHIYNSYQISCRDFNYRCLRFFFI
jgi:hypothetical protein